jgi:hypothetical protein
MTVLIDFSTEFNKLQPDSDGSLIWFSLITKRLIRVW